MHTSTVRTPQARHLQENLITHLARGKEWATPGIEAALHRALTGIDSGIEAASPRIQASLRTIADELAGGVDTVTPRLHERITRILPATNAVSAETVQAERPARKPWWLAGVSAAVAFCGIMLWRSLRPVGQPAAEPPAEKTPDEDSVPDEPSVANPPGDNV